MNFYLQTFFLSLLLLLTYSQNIVDFTYTQLDQKQAKISRQTTSINIKPDRQIIQGYTFPEACYLAGKLQQQKIEDSRDISSYDLDTMIDVLKGDFIQLLKISEKIKMKKKNIEELWQMTGKSSNITIIPNRELDNLKSQQQKLALIDIEIKQKTQQLDQQVKNSNLNSQSSQLALNSLNFEIQSLKLKIDYLRVLRRSSNDAQAAKSKDQYEKYFIDLKNKFGQQNSLISQLTIILKSYNQVGTLRSSIQHLKNKIQINSILIEEKEICAKQRDQIKSYQKKEHQIKSLMANLRLKKKDKSNINNKYCEGVAAKLLDRVKKVLLNYNYTFQCAEGLQETLSQITKDKAQLLRLQARLRQLDNNNVQQYKKKFDNNRIFIKNKQEELQKFSFPKYFHNIQELDRLIQKAQLDIQQANQKKKKLTTSSAKQIDYKKIQELVGSIKRLKGTYCVEYEKYDNTAHDLWRRIQKYEAEYQYTNKIKSIYEDETDQLKQLEASFQILRSKILDRIE